MAGSEKKKDISALKKIRVFGDSIRSLINKPLTRKLSKHILAVITVVVVCACSYFKVFERYELQTFDLRFQLRPLQKMNADIAIIEIANDTLNALGVWPIDRGYHAYLIDILSKYGARLIVFDINLPEKSVQAENPNDPNSSDNLLASAIRASKRVIMPVAYYFDSVDGEFYAKEEMVGLLPKFRRGAFAIGHVNVLPDIDGKVRKIIPKGYWAGHESWYLGLLAAIKYLDIPYDKVTFNKAKNIQIGDYTKAPLLDSSEMLVNFSGKWVKTFKHYSMIDIIQSHIALEQNEKPIMNLEQLQGLVCFIGLTATGTFDQFPTPVDNRYPGIGVHASIFNSIIEKSFIFRLPRWMNLLILILLAFLLHGLVKRSNPFMGFFLFFIVITGFTAFAFLMFIVAAVWIDIVYPLFIASLIYLGMTFSFFIRERTRREILEHELDIAKKIQQSFLPEEGPSGKGIDIAFHMITARHVGGDLYDFVQMKDKIGILLGDVSGKGVPAALYMAKAVSEFKLYAKNSEAPSNVITNLNNQLAEEEAGNLFVTLMYLVWEPSKHQLAVTSAGHGPLLVFHAKEGAIDFHDVNEGTPVGVFENEYEQAQLTLASGDIIALYTDGVSEARSVKGDEYGEERLKNLLLEKHSESAKSILDALYEDVRIFSKNAKQHDDITAIIIKIE